MLDREAGEDLRVSRKLIFSRIVRQDLRCWEQERTDRQ